MSNEAYPFSDSHKQDWSDPTTRAINEANSVLSMLPVSEVFEFWIDTDGDFVIQATDRHKRSEFLAAHGATPNEAVANMADVLKLADATRKKAGLAA